MKKFIAILLAALLMGMFLCSCGGGNKSDVSTGNNPNTSGTAFSSGNSSADTSASSLEPSSDTTTMYDLTDEDFSLEALCTAYVNGTWNGEFIYNANHCASIDDTGEIRIDNAWTNQTPDMPISDSNFYVYHRFISKCSLGSYYVNQEDGCLELYRDGTMLSSREWSEVYEDPDHYQFGDDLFIYQYGDTLKYWNDGQTGIIAEQVLDTTMVGGKVRYSTLDHNVYQLDETTMESTLVDRGIWFKNFAPLTKTSEEDATLYKLLKEAFFSGDWNGENIQVSAICDDENRATYEGIFARIGARHEIFVNNAAMFWLGLDGYYYDDQGDFNFVANTANITTSYGRDTLFHLLWADDGMLRCFSQNGFLFATGLPEGDCEILGVSGCADNTENYPYVIALKIDKSIYVFYIENEHGEMFFVTDKAADACATYDTLYWVSTDGSAYSVDYTHTNESIRICDKAYAVVRSGGEIPSACFVVDPELANCIPVDNVYLFSPDVIT